MAQAKIEKFHGEPAIIIDGKAFPPMIMTANDFKNVPENTLISNLTSMGDAGFRLYYVSARMDWIEPSTTENSTLCEISSTLKSLERLFTCVPDAYAIIRLTVSPSVAWVNSHPEEQFSYSDGKNHPTICTSVSTKKINGMFSFCSDVWKSDTVIELKKYLDALEQSPYFKRVAGFFLCVGGTDEWYYPKEGEEFKESCSDYSKPYLKFYSNYLKNKYHSDERLQKVWNRTEVTLNDPIIPTLEERRYVKEIDKDISEALLLWEREGRLIDAKLNMNGKGISNTGVLLNANGYEHVADHYDALGAGTADVILFFAKFFKERYPNLLLGAFYGSMGCQDYYDYGTSTSTLSIMNSGLVDYLSAPTTYNNCEPGGVAVQQEMQDSFRIRNQLFISEEDTKIHTGGPWMQINSMGLYSEKEDLQVLKRDFGHVLCDEINGWWYGWYNIPAIQELFAKQQKIAEKAFELDRTKKNEIALIYDLESIHHISDLSNRLVFDSFRTSDVHRIGAPVDFYFHNDMVQDDMPDYKLYVMMNLYFLSDSERDAIIHKARKNHAIIIWLYAAGLYNPDKEPMMSVDYMSALLGMNVQMMEETFVPEFRINPKSHPAVKDTFSTRVYGYIDRNVHSNVWISRSILPTTYANPGFYVSDDAITVLGKYLRDDRPALVLKEMDGYTNIYCSTLVPRNDLIRSIAKYAGCHIYNETDDILFANNNFVVLHASSDGEKTIRFRNICSPYEVYEEQYYAHNVLEITVKMEIGDTKMWCINDNFRKNS